MADRQRVLEALGHHFGFDKFKGNQEEIIHSLLDGHDVFVLMPTGGGKSLCYQLPALMSEGCAVVISPLIALMKNQVDSIRQFEENDDVAHFLNSSLNRAQSEKVRRDVVEGRTKLLYVAPESLTKEDNINFLKGVNVSFYAVDEAHCISEWGHDFRPEYRRIRSIINVIGARPMIALTATATPKVQHDIQKNLGMSDAHVYKSSFNRRNLYYEVRPKTKDVGRDLIRLIKSRPGQSGIVYCLSRKKVEEIAEMLRVNDIAALAYHAGMDPATRASNQDAFLHEQVDVIVATIAFGMGIDKPDVRYVVHYDIPKSLEGYYQETGRAGRDGGEGCCITFYSRKDLQKLEKLIQTKSPSEQEIGRQLLQETAGYAESSVCRRRILLHYFGEDFEEENCGACDNCLHPKTRIEASDELCAVIEAVQDIQERFRAEYLVNFLVGRRTDEIRSYKHDVLESFGILEGRDDKFVSALVHQGVIAGYLRRDLENYGIIKVTESGRRFLENPGRFEVVEDNDFNDCESESMPRGGGAADEQLFAILKAQRKSLARRVELPPYVIFQDPSLEAMATTYPVTVEELQTIPGVGVGKAKRYGAEFLEIIRKYVEDNDIERPEDFKVRTIASRSKTKVFLIQGIDRKIPLDELADNKGLDFLELLDELESIVEGGIKINIDYYLNELLDDDLQEDIMEYLREGEEDNLEEAISDLADDYTEEEVRLVRIKFISDMGN